MDARLNCGEIVAFSTLQMLSGYTPDEYNSIPRKLLPPKRVTDNSDKRNFSIRDETSLSPQQRLLLQPPQFGISPFSSSSVFGFNTGMVNIKRPRGEKKPIPEEQKDERYFERRKRNNQAAKKSRDARRMREDQVAFRATFLEQENAVLRAQILTLREEAQSLRQLLLLQRKTSSYICLPTNAT